MLWLKTSGALRARCGAPPPRRRGSRASAPRRSPAGSFALIARIVAAKWPAPRSGMSSRSTEVTTTCLSSICAAAWPTRSGSSGSGACSGLPGVDVAVAAGAGARLAEDLEGRGAAAPALGDVRAAGLLADRVQRESVQELLDVEIAAVRARRADLHPFGPAGSLGDGKRRLHPRESAAERSAVGGAQKQRLLPAHASPPPIAACQKHVRLLLGVETQRALEDSCGDTDLAPRQESPSSCERRTRSSASSHRAAAEACPSAEPRLELEDSTPRARAEPRPPSRAADSPPS